MRLKLLVVSLLVHPTIPVQLCRGPLVQIPVSTVCVIDPASTSPLDALPAGAPGPLIVLARLPLTRVQVLLVAPRGGKQAGHTLLMPLLATLLFMAATIGKPFYKCITLNTITVWNTPVRDRHPLCLSLSSVPSRL